MADRRLRICSFNVCGLNNVPKRKSVITELRLTNPDILCLQETHVPWSNRRILSELGFTLLSTSKQSIMNRGVAILVRHGIIGTGRLRVDNLGRWAITECIVGCTKIALCTVYGSSLDESEILEFLNVELALWGTPLIILGDFIIHGDAQTWDSQFAKYKGRKPKVFRALQKLLQNHRLVDGWIAVNHGDPGYTFFSSPHNKFVRLDYIFLPRLLIVGAKMQVWPRITSDHRPMVMDLASLSLPQEQRSFTFNKNC